MLKGGRALANLEGNKFLAPKVRLKLAGGASHRCSVQKNNLPRQGQRKIPPPRWGEWLL